MVQALPGLPCCIPLVKGFVFSQAVNSSYNHEVILLLVFHWETDSASPSRILVRGPKNHTRLPQTCFRNPEDCDAVHQGVIRSLKGDTVMIVGPTPRASGKLCLLGSFQKNTLLPPKSSSHHKWWALLLYWAATWRIIKGFCCSLVGLFTSIGNLEGY